MGHRTNAVLVVPRTGTRAWLARCEECGPVTPEPYDPYGDLGPIESYRRAQADARAHEQYPNGSVMVIGGAEVWLR